MIINRKLTDSSFAATEVEGLDDRPQISAQELKQRFDANMKDVMAPAFNAVIDDLGKTDDGGSGADNIGCTPVGNGSANTVQGALEEWAVKVVSISLTAEDWSSNEQTVSVQGVTSDNIIIVSIDAATASSAVREEARNAFIYATAQDTDSVTFRYDGTLPTEDIPMNVMIAG